MTLRSAFALILLVLAQCTPTPLPPPPSAQVRIDPTEDFRPVSGEANADDIARFLAGRPVIHGRELSSIQTSSTAYHSHALELDRVWDRTTTVRRRRQSAYYYDTISSYLGDPDTILYPFGGPDILFASAMFPRASTYVLVGLEPVGSLELADPAGVLPPLRRVMENPLRHGYFVTKEMKNSPSVTTILLASLGLTRAEIDEVAPVSAAGRPGVRIDYRTRAGDPKRVIYVTADLSNSGFDPALAGWLERYRGATSYFKAASYLMHDSAFSDMRSWVLANSSAILQDDSGIPYRYFDGADWRVTLLGTYDRPIPLFSEWRQPDLAAAYAAQGGRGPEIPFGSGYHLRYEDANYQIAVRR